MRDKLDQMLATDLLLEIDRRINASPVLFVEIQITSNAIVLNSIANVAVNKITTEGTIMQRSMSYVLTITMYESVSAFGSYTEAVECIEHARANGDDRQADVQVEVSSNLIYRTSL